MPTVAFTVLQPAPSLPQRTLPANDVALDIYGTDILFRAGVRPLTPAGDFTHLGGPPNLWAAIWRRMITKPGEYAIDPTYGAGLLEFVKKKLTRSRRALIESRIRNQLSYEPRVERVESVELEVGTNARSLIIRVVAVVAGRTRRFSPFTLTQEAA